jgi:ribosomal-protein-alanine N-acetyltransferase
MAASDIPELLAIEEDSPVWSETQFAGELDQPNGWQFVAVDSGIVGYICGRLVLDEAEIVKIAVKRQSRRQGIATRLLQHSLESASQQGARICYLEVRRSNVPARSFYEKNGFSQSGIRKKYYTSPREDAVAMMKKWA